MHTLKGYPHYPSDKLHFTPYRTVSHHAVGPELYQSYIYRPRTKSFRPSGLLDGNNNNNNGKVLRNVNSFFSRKLIANYTTFLPAVAYVCAQLCRHRTELPIRAVGFDLMPGFNPDWIATLTSCKLPPKVQPRSF